MDIVKLIQVHNLRECIGKRDSSAWDRLLPILIPGVGNTYHYHLPSGNLLATKIGGRAVCDQLWESKLKFWKPKQKVGITTILTRDIGLGRRLAELLADRPKSVLLRIQDFISGMVDSLWCADEKIFILSSVSYKLLKHIVRKIFAVGCHDLGSLVSDWKIWSNHLFHVVAKTKLIGDPETPRYNNIFVKMNSIEFIRDLWAGKRDMLLLQKLSHIVSSRQFPYMGKKTEEKSQQQFTKVVTDGTKTDIGLLMQLSAAARRVGGICRKLHPGPVPDGAAHISVTSSGELYHSISKGAQAAAVKEAMLRILNHIPEKDFTEDTPFGPAEHVQGLPLWQTLFVPIEIWDFRTRKKLFQQAEGMYTSEIKDPSLTREQINPSIWGLDEYTGRQIMYVAWKESSQGTIPLRAEVVPEMGNKARIVTLSPYWVNVLQAPLAHLIIEALKWHPSVFSSFHRQDQAWEAVKGLVRLKDISLDDQYVLSSDLKDATNSQRWDVSKSLLHGFLSGFDPTIESEYVNLVIDMIGPRQIKFKDNTMVVTQTGVMMGEALAKPALTLLNLSIEELAFLQHTGRTDLLYLPRPAPDRDWRCCHIGGDDHLIKGPLPYLQTVTDIHRAVGSRISPGQHGYSQTCVKYCERLINLENLQYRQAFHKDYRLSTIVDSVKVRLLERGQSTMLKKDNRNVAIGKAKQLSGCLEWLPNDDHFWPRTKKESIRALFVKRMGPLMPKKAVNPRAYAAIHLPTIVGGFGLGFRDELKYWFAEAPLVHQWFLSKLMMGAGDRTDYRLFRPLNTNVSSRGSIAAMEAQLKFEDRYNSTSRSTDLTWDQLKQKFPDPMSNNQRVLAIAEKGGYLPVEELAKRATRGDLFRALLDEPQKLKIFNTRPYVSTYSQIWERAVDLGWNHYGIPNYDTLSWYDIESAIANLMSAKFIKYNEYTLCTFKYDNDGMYDHQLAKLNHSGPNTQEKYLQDVVYLSVPILEAFQIGKPQLSLGKAFLQLSRF